jgi:hypothetical protein
MHNTSTCLEIRDTIFKDGNPDRYAGIHRVIGKVEPTDRASIYPAPLLLQLVHKLNCFYLGSSRDSARREYRTESIKSGEKSGTQRPDAREALDLVKPLRNIPDT